MTSHGSDCAPDVRARAADRVGLSVADRCVIIQSCLCVGFGSSFSVCVCVLFAQKTTRYHRVESIGRDGAK